MSEAAGRTSIDGVGGAFVFSEDPKRLADWYAEHLGIRSADGGRGLSYSRPRQASFAPAGFIASRPSPM